MFPNKYHTNASSLNERNSLYSQLSTKSNGPGARRPKKETGDYTSDKRHYDGQRPSEMDLRVKLNQQRFVLGL